MVDRRIYAAMISTILVLAIFGAQKSAALEKHSKADILGSKSLKLICKNKTKFLGKSQGFPGYFDDQENFLVLVSKKERKIITYEVPWLRTVAEIRSSNFVTNKEKRIRSLLGEVEQILNKTKNFYFYERESDARFWEKKIVARYTSHSWYREKTIDRNTLEMTDKRVFSDERGFYFKATHKCKIADDDNQIKSILAVQEKKWRDKAYEFVKEAKPIVKKYNERLKKRKI
jgi:hypothetical protein